MDPKKIKEKTGIELKNPELLKRSLTHRSAKGKKLKHKDSNERLEFLGDAVLEYIVSDVLYTKFPSEDEGFLTKLRAALVCEKNLSKVGKKLGIGEFLKMGRGEEASGGREKGYILANTVEALIGATYIDQGIEATKSFVERTVLAELKDILERKLYLDAKTTLQEYVQAKEKITPKYQTLRSEGPEHKRTFTVTVTIRGKKFKGGKGKTKQEAQEIAARKTLKYLKKFGFKPVI